MIRPDKPLIWGIALWCTKSQMRYTMSMLLRNRCANKRSTRPMHGWITSLMRRELIDRTAVASVAGRIQFYRVPQRFAVYIGPQGVDEDKFGISRLPEREFHRGRSAGVPQKGFRAGNAGAVELLGDGLLIGKSRRL